LAQELARKGVSDVATAVTKTSGITKQEGSGNIFVRGLGDRYNSTTMNGLPIPSNDPEKKNLNLEIFSTDIVEYISIDKGGSIYGDFAGGNVDIISKDYKGKGF
jgi:outer membrane receptor for ferrienterochelin and colicin